MPTTLMIARRVVFCLGVASASTSLAQSTSYLKPPITNWTHPPVSANLNNSSTTQAANPPTQNMADSTPPAPPPSSSLQRPVTTTKPGGSKHVQSAGTHANSSSLADQPIQNMAALIRPAPMVAAASGPGRSAKSAQPSAEHAQPAIASRTKTPVVAVEDARSLPQQASGFTSPAPQRQPIDPVQALFDLQASGRVSGSPIYLLGSDLSASYARFLDAGKSSSSGKRTISAGSASMPGSAPLTNFGSQP